MNELTQQQRAAIGQALVYLAQVVRGENTESCVVPLSARLPQLQSILEPLVRR